MTAFVFLLITTFSYYGVYLIRHYVKHRRILDHPNERSSHTVPTPRGGGLALVLLVLGTGLWFVLAAGFYKGLIFLVGSAAIAWLGWRDDLHSLPPRFRFLIQGMVAARFGGAPEAQERPPAQRCRTRGHVISAAPRCMSGHSTELVLTT